jgi:hypothetical protein
MGFKINVNVTVYDGDFNRKSGVYVTVKERDRLAPLAEGNTDANGVYFEQVDLSGDQADAPSDVYCQCTTDGSDLCAGFLLQAAEPFYAGEDTVKTYTYEGQVMMLTASQLDPPPPPAAPRDGEFSQNSP